MSFVIVSCVLVFWCVGKYQTFAKVFSKFAVWSRKAESRRKLRARLEPRATILYGRAKLCVSRLQKVHFHGNSCAAHTRKPETEPIRQKSGFCLGQHSKMKTLTQNDVLFEPQLGLCEELLRKFRESCGVVVRKNERKVALKANESLVYPNWCARIHTVRVEWNDWYCTQ